MALDERKHVMSESSVYTVPQLRDDAAVTAVLSDWLTARDPGGSRVEIVALRRPQGSGASNETLLVRTLTSAQGAEPVDLVLRIAPTTLQFVFEPRFAEQYQVLDTLGRNTDIPVPKMLGYEADTSLFGAPFWVMSHVQGRAPADFPPYSQEGWLFDATPEQRRRVWRSGVEALGALASVPVGLFDFLDDPARGDGGLRQSLQYWREALDWASTPMDNPVLEQVYEWLVAHFPQAPMAGLSWGDARIGNLLFDGGRCTAVLDWELLSLGGPLTDLCYWLMFDEMLTTGLELPRLDGFGTREETLDLWQETTGTELPDLTWYEIFCWFRLASVMMRSDQMRRAAGRPVPGPGEFGCLSDVADGLARRLGLSTAS
ncbi:phosphotransferase family protein [Nocardia sp. CA-135953]|uniref:phosphotransferase family protein n=1 Tax=Nocardia sp. CA-135953 TaxID=3239978 RepID=UPI003D975572